MLFLLVGSSVMLYSQPNITKMEYFIDTDPGINSGVDIPLTAAATIDMSLNVPTGALSDGFHTISIRALDANGEWSIVENRVFFVSQASSITTNNITKIEYFIDTDPGRGSGVDVSLTPNTILDFTELVPTGSLGEGFHTITFRAQDENGQWGLQENKLFFINQSSTLSQNNITKLEYFIDADPGRGSGVDVPITPATSFDISENVPTGVLSEGFHVITFRTQDENGEWSMQENKLFYVNQSSTIVTNNITKLEYYIDSDPGHGSGVDIPITASISLDVLDNVPTASLSEGFHTITIRAQDENGEWSLQENKAFYVTQSSTLAINDITKVEYYVDNDPGHGLGVDVPITAAATIDITENIPTGSLSVGFHTASVRVQDTNGIWSLIENKVFYVSRTLNAVSITKLEYYIDTDPGHGSGTDIPITGSTTLNILENLTVGSLSVGMHSLHIRAQDENGIWGMEESKMFFVDRERQVIAYEYAIDTDPGEGLASFQSITPQNPIDEALSINTGSLSIGLHKLYIRVKDENQFWSLTDSIEFNLCDGATANFSTANECTGTPTAFIDSSTSLAGDTYSWDFDGDNLIDDNTVGNSSFVYSSAGTYNAKLWIDRSGCTDSLEVVVNVNTSPIANAGIDTDICMDNISLSASSLSANEIGTWSILSGDGSIADVNAASTTYSGITSNTNQIEWSVNNSVTGCTTTDAITINYEPTIADAGLDELTCVDNIQLNALSLDANETGVWSVITGDGTLSDPSILNPNYQGITASLNELEWRVTNAVLGCEDADTVRVEYLNLIVDAGVDQFICIDNASLSGSLPNANETGTWTLESGTGVISDPNDPNATISGITTELNTLRWTVVNSIFGCDNFDDVTVYSNQLISTTDLNISVTIGSPVITMVDDITNGNVGDIFTVTLMNTPSKGMASVNASSIEYQPNLGTIGQDVVEFEVCNQCGNCDRGSLIFDILNNSPQIDVPIGDLGNGSNFTLNLIDFLSDLNDNIDLSSLSIIQQPISGAVASIDEEHNLLIDYTGILFAGTDMLVIQVCDFLGACTSSDIFIEVNLAIDPSNLPPIIVYNAVSPNGDGKHDYLELQFITDYPSNKLIIFNRWGNKVYEVSGYDNDHVKFEGVGNRGGAGELPSGTYFYLLDLGETTRLEGFFLLKN